MSRKLTLERTSEEVEALRRALRTADHWFANYATGNDDDDKCHHIVLSLAKKVAK